MINVTKSFLPPLELYQEYLKGIWERNHLTNHGPLVLELEAKLKVQFDEQHFFYVNNGTLALQLAIKALDLKGEIITTPFSYVATASSIVWEGCTPVFVDIHDYDFTINEDLIEAAITARTTAILGTHVYGIPCHVEAIQNIAKKYGLKIIYDAAHAFGVRYKNTSLMTYGDVSTLSFHATKLFHTVEGGGLVTSSAELAHRIGYMRNFGHKGQESFWGLGINGKSSEFHAAMGLCVLPQVSEMIKNRKDLCLLYDYYLLNKGFDVSRPIVTLDTEYNYAYYPIVFKTYQQLLLIKEKLNAASIFPRRYFYPSLNKLPYITSKFEVPVAEDISNRVLCLPLYFELDTHIVEHICSIIVEALIHSK